MLKLIANLPDNMSLHVYPILTVFLKLFKVFFWSINRSGSDGDEDGNGLLISTIVLAVVAGILLLVLAVMLIMGRSRSNSKKGDSSREAIQ